MRTGYLYDNGRLIAQYDASKKVTAQYVHGSGLGGDVGSLLFSQTLIDQDGTLSLETSYYLHNHRGDVVAVTNEAGTDVNTYRYSAFGEIIDQTTQRENDILFSSKKFDSSTDLSYFGARYYDASIGRFISRDPLGYIDGPNGYIYVNNNPINLIDPFGLSKLGFFEKIADVANDVVGWVMDNDPELQEFVAGAVLNALGFLSDGMTVTAVVASPLSGGASLALVPATVSVSNVCHAAGTALMAHATFSMASNAFNSNNDDQGQSEAQKSTISPDGTKMSADGVADTTKAIKKTQRAKQLQLFEEHHIVTNKNKKYTHQMKKITDKYNLNLNDGWNIEYMRHSGRHANKYHNFVLKNLQKASETAEEMSRKHLRNFRQDDQRADS